MPYRPSLFILGCVSFVVACSQSANPTRPSPVTAANVVEWSALAGGRNSTMSVVSADAPPPPSNLTSMLNGSTLTLAWTASSGATSYLVEAGTGAGLTNITSFNTGSAGTTITVPGVPAGTFYVRVRARNADGTSGPSNEVSFTVGGGTCTAVPNAPTNLTSSLNGDVLTLTWNAPVGGCPVESYIIVAGTTDGGSNLADFDTGSTNTTFFANVGGVLDVSNALGRSIAAAGIGEFYVQVAGVNRNGRGARSNARRVTRPSAPKCVDLWLAARGACDAKYRNAPLSSGCYGACMNAAEAYYQRNCPGVFQVTSCNWP
jgi:fibronectin type III domain protein